MSVLSVKNVPPSNWKKRYQQRWPLRVLSRVDLPFFQSERKMMEIIKPKSVLSIENLHITTPPSSLKKLNSSNQYSLLFLLLLLYLFWVSYILYPYVIVIECRTLLMQLSITIFPMTTEPKNRRDIIFDPF